MNINLLIFKRIEFMQRKLICIFEDLLKFKGNVIICIKVLVMSKNNLYIPLKVVPYIFISITAIAITAATYVIT